MEGAVGYPYSKFQVSRWLWSKIGTFFFQFTQNQIKWNECLFEMMGSFGRIENSELIFLAAITVEFTNYQLPASSSPTVFKLDIIRLGQIRILSHC